MGVKFQSNCLFHKKHTQTGALFSLKFMINARITEIYFEHDFLKNNILQEVELLIIDLIFNFTNGLQNLENVIKYIDDLNAE